MVADSEWSSPYEFDYWAHTNETTKIRSSWPVGLYTEAVRKESQPLPSPFDQVDYGD